MSRVQRSAEQDQAAGGRHHRVVIGPQSAPLASVYFRRPSGRRVYAYVRWSAGGRTIERYVCEAGEGTRAANLERAWAVVREQGLLEPYARREPRLASASASWASSDAVRRVMQSNTGRDTRPERVLRSLVHGLGMRYRVSTRPVPGVRRTADLVFPAARVAVFVDGCFWHGCGEHYRRSTKNQAFWDEKIDSNRRRDRDTDQRLNAAGWEVVRVWEHEVGPEAALRVRDVVRARKVADVDRRVRAYPLNPDNVASRPEGNIG
jgi:DNA mismatch endonuclease (patch repair protein)